MLGSDARDDGRGPRDGNARLHGLAGKPSRYAREEAARSRVPPPAMRALFGRKSDGTGGHLRSVETLAEKTPSTSARPV